MFQGDGAALEQTDDPRGSGAKPAFRYPVRGCFAETQVVCPKTSSKGGEELSHERLRRRHDLGETARFATKVVG